MKWCGVYIGIRYWSIRMGDCSTGLATRFDSNNPKNLKSMANSMLYFKLNINIFQKRFIGKCTFFKSDFLVVSRKD